MIPPHSNYDPKRAENKMKFIINPKRNEREKSRTPDRNQEVMRGWNVRAGEIEPPRKNPSPPRKDTGKREPEQKILPTSQIKPPSE